MPETAGINYAISSGGSPTGDPPLILIHGAGGSRLHWPPELRRLEGRVVYSIDVPGHGRSEGSGVDRIAGYTDRVARWMEAMDLPPAIVAGHSMGGAIAQQLAYDHRQRLAGLILIGTGSRLPVNKSLLELTSSAKTFPQAAELIIRWQFSRQVDPALVELAQEAVDQLDHRVMHADLVACSRFDVSERHPRVDLVGLPTLVICGQEDKMTPLAMNQALVDFIPQAELVTVPSAGHMVMLEQPAEVAAAIQAFLNQHNL
jgi:pimeloyl-ACP methyl ester carboxylesterase